MKGYQVFIFTPPDSQFAFDWVGSPLDSLYSAQLLAFFAAQFYGRPTVVQDLATGQFVSRYAVVAR